MNAGCYGAETRDVCVRAHGLDREGRSVSSGDPAAWTYRHGWGAEEDVVVTRAEFQGRSDDPAAVERRMADITARREKTQPVREKDRRLDLQEPGRAGGARRSARGSWSTTPAGAASRSAGPCSPRSTATS